MKRNRFRLETVMRIRRTQEDVEVGRLSLALGAAAAARAVETEREQRYLAAVQHPAGGWSAERPALSTDAFLADRSMTELMGDAVVVAQAEVATADAVVDERRVDWSLAAKRVAALERLHERHVDAHHAAVLAEESSDADERTMARRLREMQATSRTSAVPRRPRSLSSSSGGTR